MTLSPYCSIHPSCLQCPPAHSCSPCSQGSASISHPGQMGYNSPPEAQEPALKQGFLDVVLWSKVGGAFTYEHQSGLNGSEATRPGEEVPVLSSPHSWIRKPYVDSVASIAAALPLLSTHTHTHPMLLAQNVFGNVGREQGMWAQSPLPREPAA